MPYRVGIDNILGELIKKSKRAEPARWNLI